MNSLALLLSIIGIASLSDRGFAQNALIASVERPWKTHSDLDFSVALPDYYDGKEVDSNGSFPGFFSDVEYYHIVDSIHPPRIFPLNSFPIIIFRADSSISLRDLYQAWKTPEITPHSGIKEPLIIDSAILTDSFYIVARGEKGVLTHEFDVGILTTKGVYQLRLLRCSRKYLKTIEAILPRIIKSFHA